MIERLLLDGINAKAGAAAISVQNHLPAAVLPHETKASVTVFERARPRAQITDDASIRRMPPSPDLVAIGRQCAGRIENRAFHDDVSNESQTLLSSGRLKGK